MAMIDFCCISGDSGQSGLDNRVLEYVHHLHDQMYFPAEIVFPGKNAEKNQENAENTVRGGRYKAPAGAECGYSVRMKEDWLAKYEFPQGEVWRSEQ